MINVNNGNEPIDVSGISSFCIQLYRIQDIIDELIKKLECDENV